MLLLAILCQFISLYINPTIGPNLPGKRMFGAVPTLIILMVLAIAAWPLYIISLGWFYGILFLNTFGLVEWVSFHLISKYISNKPHREAYQEFLKLADNYNSAN